MGLACYMAASMALAMFSAVNASVLVERTGPTPEQPSCVDFTSFVYAGCFKDDASPRTLLYASNLSSKTMTVEKCVAFCKGNDYKYAGLEYYGECYCGASVNAMQIDEASCSFPCNGNKTQSCGGGKIISIYQDPTFPVVSNTMISDYMPMGCYSEGPNGRTLGWRQDNVNPATLTVEKCLSACLSGSYAFAGVEYGRECYCGVVLGNGTLPLRVSECDMRCTGDSTQFCGGRSKLNLYVAKSLESTEPCKDDDSASSSSSTLSSTSTSSSTLSSSVSTTTVLSTTTSELTSASSFTLPTFSSSTISSSSTLLSSSDSTSTLSSTATSVTTTSAPSGSSGVLPTPITTSSVSTLSSSSSTTSRIDLSSTSTTSSSPILSSIIPTPPVTTSSTTSQLISTAASSSDQSSSSVTTSSPPSSSSVLASPVSTSDTASSGTTTSVVGTSSSSTIATSTSYSSFTLSSTTPNPIITTSTSQSTSVGSSTSPSKTYPSTATFGTTTKSIEICTSYYTIFPPVPTPTCAYRLGKWCAKPLLEFSDTFTCLKAFASCVTQLSACFSSAGYPELLRCNEFNQYCSRIATFCDDFCPGNRCTLSSCRQVVPAYGIPVVPSQLPGTIYSSLYTCPPFNLPTTTFILPLPLSTPPVIIPATTSRQNQPTPTPSIPTYTNICTQPNNPTNGYGPSSPVGGIPLPKLSCNNELLDYNSGHPYKLYTSPDTYRCPSYKQSGSEGPSQGCRDACDEQFKLCNAGYAEPFKGYNKSKRAGKDDYSSASKRCENQRDDCYSANMWVSGGKKCETFNAGY